MWILGILPKSELVFTSAETSETYRHGHMDSWRHGHMDSWRHGHKDTWTRGDVDTLTH
jgi:hypothetical protein